MVREQCEKDEGRGKRAAVGGKRGSKSTRKSMGERKKGKGLKLTSGGKVWCFFIIIGKKEGES